MMPPKKPNTADPSKAAPEFLANPLVTKVEQDVMQATEPVAEEVTDEDFGADNYEVIMFEGDDAIPCNWNFVPLDDDQVFATNTQTGSTFEGTMDEFNDVLRGV